MNRYTGLKGNTSNNNIAGGIAQSLSSMYRAHASEVPVSLPITTTGVYQIIRQAVEQISHLPLISSSFHLRNPQALEEAIYNLMVVTAHQILTKIAIAQHGSGLHFDHHLDTFKLVGNTEFFQSNLKPVADFIHCIGAFQHGSTKFIPTLIKGLFTDVSQLKDLFAIDVDRDLKWLIPSEVEEKHVAEARSLLNEFRGEPKVVGYPSIPKRRKAEEYVNNLFREIQYQMDNFVIDIDFKAPGSPCQLAACFRNDESEFTFSWSSAKLTGDELLVGSIFGFGRKIFGENSIMHDRRLEVVRACFTNLNGATKDLVYSYAQTHSRW